MLMMLIYWEKDKHTFCEGNERVAFLIISKEFSIVENGEVKEGQFSAKSYLKEEYLQVCQR